MGADQHIDWRTAAASALEWWRDAGVDASIDESPRDWLAPVEPPKPVRRVQAVAAAPVVARPLPSTLAAFEAWRLGPEAPEADWPGQPLAAQGPSSSNIMVLIDLPEREDADSGILMSGPAGRLFDRMLAAIGRDRGSIYLVPVCASRPVAGRVAPEIEERLNQVARHHVLLAAPKRLLLLGNAPSRALLGADAARMRGSLHGINLGGGKGPPGDNDVATQAVASFHPRFLIERPAAKAEAWKDLQMLIGDLDT
ncbi:MAG: uracil-DNA glycosylase [Pseudomonadota bacterium]|jgi:DNA polymerase|uniref:Uracil-DNA glycosylase, family 4 n=1 Tax=hydrothermal vent metagenome TaxID=652676 RepID=A0A160TLQ3_9ZZZZ|nr:uracil-DNA glycosylase [Sphingomonas sp.]WEK01391.1 MAG: uracil-DNA glycosylase [Sphingomonas sp.]